VFHGFANVSPNLNVTRLDSTEEGKN